MKTISLVTLAIAATSLLPQVAMGAGIVNTASLGSVGSTINGVTSQVTSSVNGVASGNSLVNVSGNQVSANPAVCANVLSSGACTSTATQNSTNASSVGTSTGDNGIASGNSLVNLSGNQVNVNPAVCANLVSSGNCTSTATQTTTNTSSVGGGGVGGGSSLPQAVEAGVGGGALPRAGMTALALVLSMIGSAGAAVVSSRKRFA